MKIVIFGLPNQIDNEEVMNALAIAAQTLGVNIRGSILERNDILPSSNQPIFIKRKEDSEFIQSCKQIEKVCGDIVRNPSARSKFWELVVKKIIERPILEVLAFGPKTAAEYEAMRDMGGDEFVKICKAALALIENI